MAKKEDQEEGKDITQEKDTLDQNDSGKEETTEEVVQEPTMEDKFNELNDKYLRLYSDFDNFRKRTIKEKADLISNANAGVLKDLLTVLDDFERAIQSNENTEDVNGLKEGFQLIYNKFNGILASKGLKPMESKGTPFDLDLHEAITNVPVEKEEEKGKVIDVVEKGYYLHEKVIRYAKVIVGQ
ncbi:MAG: nucleotide exchange factor GrpE [Crocinitomicaceae bacterium]|nr:nucleotide exchange factor GrpE [Crocinitomicaceae bacterium]